MNTAAKRYLREFLLAMALYTLAVVGTSWLLKRSEPSPWRFLIAVIPLIPSALALMSILRFVRSMDELQQRIQLYAISFAASATAMVTLTVGFLENAGFPRPSWIWVCPMLIWFWGLGLFMFTRRYK
jgi:hypothetical protein